MISMGTQKSIKLDEMGPKKPKIRGKNKNKNNKKKERKIRSTYYNKNTLFV